MAELLCWIAFDFTGTPHTVAIVSISHENWGQRGLLLVTRMLRNANSVYINVCLSY